MYGEIEWDLEVMHVNAHRAKKKMKAMTEEHDFVMEGNEKIQVWQKEAYASIAFAAHLHQKIEEREDRCEICAIGKKQHVNVYKEK